MSSEDGEITDDELIISNGSTNIKEVFNNDIQNGSENIKEVFNNDSTNIEMGEWDDTELIETWNLALKEYNKHFSIDPKIRQKSKQTKTSNLKHQLNDYINSNQSKINQTDKIKDEKPTQNLKRKHSEDDNSIKDKVQLNNHVKVTENIIPKVQDMKKDSNNQPELVNNEPNSQSNYAPVQFNILPILKPETRQTCHSCDEKQTTEDEKLQDKIMKSYYEGYRAGKEGHSRKHYDDLFIQAWYEAGYQTSLQ